MSHSNTINLVKVERLAKRLRHLSACYYRGRPLISDDEYDLLRDELEILDPDHPFLSEIGASVKNLNTAWPEHKHASLIGSLDKISPNRDDPSLMKQEFIKWASDKGDEFILSEKYDGSTVVATYEDGVLQCLATRGDGQIGEDITVNASKIQRVPQKIKDSFTGEVRGEAILTLSDFEQYFKPDGFKNPRNAANGKVRDQAQSDLQQYVQVFWFDIIPHDRNISSEDEKWDLLKKLMHTSCEAQVLSADEIWQMYEYYVKKHRQSLDYEIDGLVVKVNDLDLQESFGHRNNRPKGAIALKFPSLEKITTLNDVIWQQGLSGRVNPVANLAPVDLGGVTVRRASLCNMDEIQRLGIAIGDEVVVSRRNDVIPKVERIYKEGADRQEIIAPTEWEGEPLVEDGAYLVTMSLDNQGPIFGNLMNWIKVNRMKGFGPAVVRALIEAGITTVADFYEAPLEVFQEVANSEKNGQKLFDRKEQTREIRLSTFLAGLNIPSLGKTNGTRLEKHFRSLDNILNASVEDFQEVRGIKTNAQKIYDGLNSRKGLIDDLRDAVKIQTLDEGGPFAGVSICITGDLSIPRVKLQEWIRENGGETKSGVSKDLSYLITNTPNSGTSKNQKADKYGVPKLTEEEFYDKFGMRPNK